MSSTLRYQWPLLLAGAFASAAPQGTPTAEEACAQAASLAASAENSRIPVQVAADCLQSVPVDVEGDLKLLEEYGLHLNWESNTAFFARPPPGYNEPRTDVLAGVEQLKEDLSSGKFTSEWEFQAELHRLVTRAYDNHFSWHPDIMSVFQFGRDDQLKMVSVSWDGQSEPALYLKSDAQQAIQDGTTPSSIKTINGQDAYEYLAEKALDMAYHDKDTRYNVMLSHHYTDAIGSGDSDGFLTSNFPVEEVSILEFEDGTTREFENYATVVRPLDDVTDGETFFAKFCTGPSETDPPLVTPKFEYVIGPELPPLPGTQERKKRSLEARQEEDLLAANGYPTPVSVGPTLGLGGGNTVWFLEEEGYTDTAILTVQRFSDDGDDEIFNAEFLQVTADLFDNAEANGKTKLIIDLRGNGGGNPFLGTDIWKRLFPDVPEPYDATRFRAWETFEEMGLIADKMLNDFSVEEALEDKESSTSNGTAFGLYEGFWNWKLPFTTEDQVGFESWEEYYGPHELNGDTFISINRNNVSSPFTVNEPTIIGYKDLVNELKPSPFEDVVIINDGICSSACAAFSELMKTQGQVEVVAVGGMHSTGPMQAIGGTKGGWVFDLATVQGFALAYYNYAVEHYDDKERLDQTELGAYINTTAPLHRSWNGESVRSQLNVQDSLRKDDETETPLEFIYEAADCRLWYTPETIFNAANLWKAVHDAKWVDNYASCVPGSTGHPSSVTGGALINPISNSTHGNSTHGNSTNGNTTYPPLYPENPDFSGAGSLSPLGAATMMLAAIASVFTYAI